MQTTHFFTAMRKLLKNKKLVGVYILWLMLHLILFMFSWGTPDRYFGEYAQSEFWPFSGQVFGRSYDYTEFIIYCIVPAGLLVAINLIFPQVKSEN